MKKLETRCYFTFIFLLSLFTGNKSCFSQIDKADSLFASTDYELASIAYHEAFYFEPNPNLKASLLLKRTACLKQIGDYSNAIHELEGFNSNCSDKLNYQIKYELALLYYLQEEYLLSNLQVQWIDRLYQDYSLNNDFFILKSLVLVQLEKYDDLEIHFNDEKYLGLFNQVELLDWFNEFKNRKIKNEKRAEWFSSFIPGWGQTYAGYFGEGVSGFVLNAAALGFMGYNFWLTNYITTFTVGSGLLSKFYFGSRRRTVHLVKKRNYQLKQEYLLDLLNIMT